MIDDLNGKDWAAVLGVAIAALLEYLINHPATAITTVIMLLITWERYKSRRYKTKLIKHQDEREEFELNIARMKHKDWLKRAKIQDEEDKLNDSKDV